MATTTVDYDSVQCLYRVRPDGETADILSVLGKKAYDIAISEGWQASTPVLRYPNTLYRNDGQTKVVQNRAEEQAAEADGWHHTVTAALAPAPENFGPLVEPKASEDTMKLALALLESNQKLADQGTQIASLTSQIASLTSLAEKLLADQTAEPSRSHHKKKVAE